MYTSALIFFLYEQRRGRFPENFRGFRFFFSGFTPALRINYMYMYLLLIYFTSNIESNSLRQNRFFMQNEWVRTTCRNGDVRKKSRSWSDSNPRHDCMRSTGSPQCELSFMTVSVADEALWSFALNFAKKQNSCLT